MDTPLVVGIVGAGGKSTLLHRLAREAAALGWRVIATTTTHMWVHQWRTLGEAKLAPTLEVARREARQLLPGGILALAHTLEPSVNKVRGLPPQWVDALAPEADVVLVEADGARGKPLKAPAAHEPVLPSTCALVILVAGWTGLGRPLHPDYVHRADRFARLSGLPLHAAVTPEAVSHVLSHPQGWLQHCPPGARVVVMVNQVDDVGSLPAARRMASTLLQAPSIDEVVLTTLHATDPVWEVYGRVGAVVLAAGAGTRFGGPKQIALWRGHPLIVHVLNAVAQASVDYIVIVLGAHRSRVRDVIARWQRDHPDVTLRVVENARWLEGQSTSVRLGVAALPGVSAAVFPLADQPRISANLVDALIATHRRTLAPAVVPRYDGQPGAPVLFDRALFPDLQSLSGDVGGRRVWQAHADHVVWVDWPEPHAARDVDTPQDLEALDGG